jgi:hypothetical protein
MVRSRDDKQAYFAKLKDFIETYREFPWGVAGVLVQGELTRALL